MRRAALLLVMLTLAMPAGAASAQSRAAADSLRVGVRGWRRANDAAVLRAYADLLAIPNVASDSANIRRNAEALRAMLERRGAEARLLEVPGVPGAPPAVYGEIRVPGATRTVMLYAHYDGQPVDAARWASPPWQPTLRDGPLPNGRVIPLPDEPGLARGDWWLYARSAGDDKGSIIAQLAALDALRALGVAPSVNVKFFFEGEEEAGSPHLERMLAAHRTLLTADVWLFGDGPVHQSRRQQLVYGVRGVMGLEMTVYGPARALHSGHYGNWAPNPAARLATLLASMRDDDGRITIAGFNADVAPVGAAERRAIAAAPRVDSALRAELAVAATEGQGAPLGERIMLPAMNVRGISSGAVGAAAANAIPTEARASIDFRLVPGQRPDRVRTLVERHVRARGWHIVTDREPTPAERSRHARVVRLDWGGGYPASRTPMSAPAARAVAQAVELAAAGPVVHVPMLGGSLPTYLFEQVLGAPLVVLPIANHDNNQHAANENMRLQNLFDGIELYAGVLAQLGRTWR